MNEYLILLLGGHDKHDAMTAEEKQDYYTQWEEYIGALTSRGVLVRGNPLERTGKIIQGNFKNQIDWTLDPSQSAGGYLIVTARCTEEAVDTLENCPIFNVDGSVELRLIEKM
jgi:hypothetical protein